MTSPNLGRRGRSWRRLVAAQRAKQQPCWLCGQPIDYTLGVPDSRSYSTDHAKPRSTHPHLAEDPDNLRTAHYGCNSSRGNKDPAPGLGVTSQEW